MANLVFILVSLVLLIGFLVLTWYEGKRGERFLARERSYLDQRAKHVEFIFTHIDLAAFLQDEARHLATRIGHDSAHLSLTSIRAVERLLTRLVRHLRTRHPVESAPRETAREFVKTLADFKGHLEATRPVREQELGELL